MESVTTVTTVTTDTQSATVTPVTDVPHFSEGEPTPSKADHQPHPEEGHT